MKVGEPLQNYLGSFTRSGVTERESRTVVCIATSTWNAAELVERFLRHAVHIGVERVYAMDYGSTDGTQEVIGSTEWGDLVRVVEFPGLDDLDSSNILLELMKAELPEDTMVLFCDPDELLALDTDRLEDLDPEGVGLVIPRTNMTGRRSEAETRDHELYSGGLLNFEIRQQLQREAVRLQSGELSHPWIWRKIGPKVAVRLGRTTEIGDGDHTATTDTPLSFVEEGALLLHHPVRSFAEFQARAADAREFLEANPHLGDQWVPRYHRWADMEASGILYDEYLDQFVKDDDVDEFLAIGRIRVNDRVFEGEAPADGLERPALVAPQVEGKEAQYHRLFRAHWASVDEQVSSIREAASQSFGLEQQWLLDEASILEAGVLDSSNYPEDKTDLVRHYVRQGQFEGVTAHPLFDSAYYRRRFMEPTSDETPLAHYCRERADSDNRPNPALNPRVYREQRDLGSTCDPLFHALIEGRGPARSATMPKSQQARAFGRRSQRNQNQYVQLREALVEAWGVERAANELALAFGFRPEATPAKTDLLSMPDGLDRVGELVVSSLGVLRTAMVQGGSRLVRVGDLAISEFRDMEASTLETLLGEDASVFEHDGLTVSIRPALPLADRVVEEAFDLVTLAPATSEEWLRQMLQKYAAARLAGLPSAVPVLLPETLPRWAVRSLQALFPGFSALTVAPLEEVSVEKLWVGSWQDSLSVDGRSESHIAAAVTADLRVRMSRLAKNDPSNDFLRSAIGAEELS